jgi:hypothetical protein
MTTAYTSLLGFALPVTGELSGTWGDTVNNSITQLEEDAIAGVATASVTSGNWTLSTTGSGASNEARKAILIPTGTPGVSRNILAPNSSKAYIVDNQSDAAVVLKGVTGPTTGITIVAGEKCLAAWSGSDFVKVSSSVADGVTTFSAGTTGFTPSTATSGAVTLAGTLATANGGTNLTSFTSGGAVYATSTSALTTGTLPVASGGTGLTSGTSGGILAYTATGTLASSGALAANNVVVGGGAGVAPSSTNLLAISAAVTTGNYIKAIGYADTVTALGNTGTAINLDVTSGGVFSATLNGNATITLRYPVSSGASSFTLILSNDATPGRTVAFVGSGATIKYPGGAASLSRTTTANAIDIWVFFTPDGGTTYYGNIAMKNMTT